MNKRETLLPATLEETVDVKPGYETSEFWITLASAIIPNTITILALLKLVPTEIASTLTTSLLAVVSGIITIIVTLKYIKSRTEIKIKSLNEKQYNKDRAFNSEVKDSDEFYKKANFYLQLQDKGLVTNAQLKKELNIS